MGHPIYTSDEERVCSVCLEYNCEELPWKFPRAKAKLKEATQVEVCAVSGVYVPLSKKAARVYLNYLEKNDYAPYIIFYTDDKTARIEHQNNH